MLVYRRLRYNDGINIANYELGGVVLESKNVNFFEPDQNTFNYKEHKNRVHFFFLLRTL